MLYKFLDMKLPADWATRDIPDRRRYIRTPDPLQADGVEMRSRVCAAEFICEQLGREISDKEFKYLARRVNKLIAGMPNWEKMGASKHATKWYGVQRSFRRIMEVTEDDDL